MGARAFRHFLLSMGLKLASRGPQAAAPRASVARRGGPVLRSRSLGFLAGPAELPLASEKGGEPARRLSSSSSGGQRTWPSHARRGAAVGSQ